MSITGNSYDTNKPAGAEFVGNPRELAQHASIVSFVVGVGSVFRGVHFVGSVARRAHSGRAAQRVNFQAGIIGNDQLTFGILAVVLGFLLRVGLEGGPVLNHRGQGAESGERSNFNVVGSGRADKV